MMKKFALTALLASISFASNAGTILLDFESNATGAAFNIGNTLTTSLGDIILDNGGSPCVSNSAQVRAGNELPTNVLCLNDAGTFDRLNFSFGVSAISGDTEYRGGGSVQIDFLDASDNVLGTFLTSNSVDAFSFSSSTPIYAIKVWDPSLNFSGLDNLRITSSSDVPEPGVLGLMGAGVLAALVARRRRG